MKEKNNYGKIVAITLAVISAASAIAYVIYRLCRNFFTFCDAYRADEIDDTDFDFDEIDDEIDEDFLIVDEEEEAATEEAVTEEPAAETAEA